FSGTISLGTPAQSFSVYFDSGSDLTWVRSSSCTSTSCIGKSLYNSAASSTYQQPPNTKVENIPYIDGTNVTGVIVTDLISAAGSSVLSTFASVTSIVGSPQSDGIMGMSPKSSFLHDLLKSSLLTTPVFGYYIADKDSTGGLVLGGVDTARYTNALQWIPITLFDGTAGTTASSSIKYWTANIVAIGVGTSTFTVAGAGMSVAFDTGSSLAVLQTSLADQVHSVLPSVKYIDSSGQTRYKLNCSGTLPNIVMSFPGSSGANVQMEFTQKEYTYLQGSPAICVSGIVGASSSQVSNMKNVGGIIGNVLLRRYYSVFDIGNLRYGYSIANRSSNVTSVLGTGSILTDPTAALKYTSDASQYSRSIVAFSSCILVMFALL
ncbi:hypothetical protein HK096_009278, partial [Nowakowskiella sp. JEL0078]